MTKKTEEILNPQIIERKVSLPILDITKLEKEIDVNTILDVGKEDDDSFFKAVVTQLFNDKDVETKSFNTGIRESFFLARLSHIAETYKVKGMEKFVERLERKRISIDRLGRQELIDSLKRRQEELDRQREIKQQEMLRGGSI